MRACLLALLLATGCAVSTPVDSNDPALDAVLARTGDQAGHVVTPVGQGPLYVVVLRDTALPFYGTPSVDGEVVGEIAPSADALQGTGRVERVHGTTWVELHHAGNRGWADARFLSRRVDGGSFCADRDVNDLLVDLELAIRERSEERLFGDISPAHGLYVQYSRTEAPVHLSDREAASRMMSDEEMTWGTGVSGYPIVGSASDLVFSEMGPALRTGQHHCNELVGGSAPYDVELPGGFQNVNFYALHNPGQHEYDWVTWIVGVEYVEGVPYVLSMHRFAWEP
jgi:hypothetical protein